jgi:DNA-damage-inducible protein J
MATATMNIRMDSEVKAQSQRIFSQFGLDMTTAINMFLRQAIRENGIPFDLHLEPNDSLVEALEDTVHHRNLHGPYKTGAEAVKSMLEDD